jgi:flavodoxin
MAQCNHPVDMAKFLVVYFSRTGYTRRVAEEVAAALGAELEALREPRDRKGFFNYMRSGREALTKRQAPIEPMVQDPAEFELVVLGTPVWAGHVSSPMRTYVAEHGRDFRSVAIFCTQHSSGADKVFRELAALVGKEPIATLAFNDRAITRAGHQDDLLRFVDRLRTTA